MLAFVLPIEIRHQYLLVDDAKLAEKKLVAALVARNSHALEDLYRSYSASLLGIITKIIKQQEVAEDVLQETFIKIWNSIDQYDESKGRLFTWMARTAKNKAIDQTRSRGEINSSRNGDLEECTLEVNQLHQVQYHPEYIGLRQLIDLLTSEQTAILELIYFQGYTQVEASERLGIPISTLKTRIRDAIKVLRALF